MAPRLWWVELTMKRTRRNPLTRVFSYVALADDAEAAIAKVRAAHGEPENIERTTAEDHGGETVAVGMRLQRQWVDLSGGAR